MNKPMDHVAYLSQEIGPRPAGTEEEQQTALYIADRLQKDAHLSVNIEDFNCNPDPVVPKLICSGVTLVATLLALLFSVLTIPAVILTIASAVVVVLEAFDRPILSRMFMKGMSQNIVAKYEPTQPAENASARRRKVIVVANYDSGKVRRDLDGPLLGIQRPLQVASLGAMVVLPVMILLRSFVTGLPGAFFTVVVIVLAIAVLIPTVFSVLEKVAAYNEAANSNAAGVAVLLEVARRLGSGEASGNADAFEGVMHDEETARAAGLVPEGASISYEYDEPVRPSKAEPAPEPIEEDLPLGTLAEAAAKATALNQAAEEAEREAAARAQFAATKAAAEEAERLAEEAAREEAAARAAAAAAAVPEWYRKATQKAHAKADRPADLIPEAASYRSRFADLPTAGSDDTLLDDSFEGDIPGDVAPEPVVEELVAEEPVIEASVEVVPEEASAAEEPTVAEEVQVAEEVVEEPATEEAVVSEEPAADEQPVAEFVIEPVDEPVAETEAAEPVAEDYDILADIAAAQPEDLKGYASVEPSVEELFVESPAMEEDAAEDPAEAAAEPVEETSLTARFEPIQIDEEPEAEEVQEEPAQPEIDPATAAAATTRLPQMMYYNPPADRSDLIRNRAQKDRVVVGASVEEAADLVAAGKADTADEAYARQQSLAQATVAMPPVEMPAEEVQPEPRVIAPNIPAVELPEVTLPPITVPKPISFDELRQRAPLATAAESGAQDAAKDLLVSSLPSIEAADTFDDDMFTADEFPVPQNTNVSMTGSFAAVSAIGSTPVGDELVADVAPEDMYVDDADDAVFEEEFTETGAFAGPGYVEMPQSRLGKFFSKFRRKKDKKTEESAADWLGVDEDFDARSVGKARGGWESFRDEDDWEGGAFSSLKARVSRGNVAEDGDEEQSERPSRNRASQYAVSSSAMKDVAAMAAALSGSSEEEEPKREELDEIKQIYSFAAGDINTEVWFVALGSELANNSGIKAFLAAHESEMRGAVIVNLESLGAGELCYLEREGYLKQMTCSARMKRFIRKAIQSSGIDVRPAQVDWRESAASYALKHRMQAMTIAGMDGDKPAGYGDADDVIENIDDKMLDQSADLVIEILKNI